MIAVLRSEKIRHLLAPGTSVVLVGAVVKGEAMSLDIDENAIQSAVTFSKDIDFDMEELPGLLWHWGRLEADAQELHLTVKADLEQKHAEIYKRLKDFANRTGEKITEAQLNAQIELDIEYRHCVSAVIEADGRARRFKAVVESLRAKRDLIIQLAYNHRAQISAGVEVAVRRG